MIRETKLLLLGSLFLVGAFSACTCSEKDYPEPPACRYQIETQIETKPQKLVQKLRDLESQASFNAAVSLNYAYRIQDGDLSNFNDLILLMNGDSLELFG